MKAKFFSLIALFMLCLSAFSQAQVTRFLGIPVDGFKKDMIKKLEAKGYEYNSYNDYLTGEFNGKDVHIHIVTNNNKVCRIMVAETVTQDETQIKINFNRLCSQFKNNKRYISFSDDQSIPEDEDIAYNMNVNNKQYEALFYQMFDPARVDTLALRTELIEELSKQFTKEQILSYDENVQKAEMEFNGKKGLEWINKMPVWFMIDKVLYGEYRIFLFYDNEYNRAHGEDL